MQRFYASWRRIAAIVLAGVLAIITVLTAMRGIDTSALVVIASDGRRLHRPRMIGLWTQIVVAIAR